MNGLTRYMLKQSLGVMMFITAGLSTAIWLTQSLRLVDLIVNRGVSLAMFLYLALLIMPRFLDLVVPIATFAAVLFSYNKFIADSELVVMRATGMSQMGLARAAIVLGILSTLIMISLSAFFLPAANRAFKDLQFQIRNEFASVALQEGVFNKMSDTLTVYVRSRSPDGELNGLLIYDSHDPEKPVIISAERGAIVSSSNGPRVLMANGVRQQTTRSTGRMTSLSFDQYTLDLDSANDSAANREREPQEMYIGELFSAGDRPGTFGSRLRVEAHGRFTGPLYCLAYTLVALGFLLAGDLDRRGQTWRVLLAIGVVLGLQILNLTTSNLAARYPVALPVMYLIPLATIACGFVAMLHRRRRRDTAGADLVEPAGALPA